MGGRIFENSFVSQHTVSIYYVLVTRLDARDTKKVKTTSKKLIGNKLESEAVSALLCD